MPPAIVRKKLIEVSIPLEAINVASAREKSIRHGHPSTLHLWWARRPLAACRAVLFAQLVDDPSSWPDRFPTEEAQEFERKRLHKIIEKIVPWEASNNEAILNEARWEIARSVAWGLGEEPPPQGDTKAILDYLQTKAPPVYDPFSGGGSIPLEAQRLGLRAYGSDLNPVAVLIGKALVEIPPKFAGQPPINPKSRAELDRGGKWQGKGAHGIAEDVRYYGQWMRDEAEKRIGHLYPKVKLPDASEATVIAWVWARTVRSPDPSAKGAMVPLVSTYILSMKEGKKAWVEIVCDPNVLDGWHPVVKCGNPTRSEEDVAREGSKTGRGSFKCVLTGAVINPAWIKSEARMGYMKSRLIAVVAEGDRERRYLTPDAEQERAAATERPSLPEIEQQMSHDPRAITPVLYELDRWDKLYSDRQFAAMKTFSDLVIEARQMCERDACVALKDLDASSLDRGGCGPRAYADAIATYLSFAVSRLSNLLNNLCQWRSDAAKQHVGHMFARQAVPMVWDFAEANPFATSAGSWEKSLLFVPRALEELNASTFGRITQLNASKDINEVACFSTDPPYYDNVGYADLSDFFYVWMRRTLQPIWPELFRRLQTPKEAELVAAPARDRLYDETEADVPSSLTTRERAERFFLRGMSATFRKMAQLAPIDVPLTIFYAFKQSELASEGVTSPGWATFLQALVNAGLSLDGTWPVRTELGNRMRGQGANALASSIVLVCRHRATDAPTVTRVEFIRAMKRELPDAIDDIRKAGVGPVDMQQSVIGPGMGVFTRYGKVLEDDDSAMSVKTAISLINRVWEEIENDLDANFDPETQVALAWFANYGFETRSSGELIMLANAKNIPLSALFSSGIFADLQGKAGLIKRDDLPRDWSPTADKTPTIWQCAQHTARVLNAPDGGGEAAARLVAEMGSKAADAQKLAYRLFEIATQKKWSAEALVYNELAQEWTKLEDIASNLEPLGHRPGAAQGAFAFDEGAR